MRRTLTNIFILLAIPGTLLPIVMSVGPALDNQRREYYWRMRLEHLHSMARDRHRRAERQRKLADERRRQCDSEGNHARAISARAKAGKL